jgi:hypothetical protein
MPSSAQFLDNYVTAAPPRLATRQARRGAIQKKLHEHPPLVILEKGDWKNACDR